MIRKAATTTVAAHCQTKDALFRIEIASIGLLDKDRYRMVDKGEHFRLITFRNSEHWTRERNLKVAKASRALRFDD